MGSPSKRISPSRGRSSPLIVAISVDLPAPLGPTMHVIFPRGTSSVTSLRMSPPPYPAVTPDTLSNALPVDVLSRLTPARRQHRHAAVLVVRRLLGDLLLGLRIVAATEIGVEHRGVGPHLVGSAGDERAALAQHRDPRAQAHHELHVVLDNEDRLSGTVEVRDPVGEVPDQRRVDAAGRLVEQQDVRVGDQQRGELEQLALTVGEVRGRLVREPRDADEVEQLHRPPPLAERAGQPRDPAQPALLALRRHEHVLEHREPGEQPRELESPPDPELEHPVRRGVRDVNPR